MPFILFLSFLVFMPAEVLQPFQLGQDNVQVRSLQTGQILTLSSAQTDQVRLIEDDELTVRKGIYSFISLLVLYVCIFGALSSDMSITISRSQTYIHTHTHIFL